VPAVHNGLQIRTILSLNFIENGFGSRAFSEKKGYWLCFLILYQEDKLPGDIRAIIKSTFYDWFIKLVQEVQTTLGMAYVVTLKDKSNIRIIKVEAEGNMETLEELKKR